MVVVVAAAELPGSCTSWLMCVFCSMVHAEEGRRRPPARGASVSSRDRLANKEQHTGRRPRAPTYTCMSTRTCMCMCTYAGVKQPHPAPAASAGQKTCDQSGRQVARPRLLLHLYESFMFFPLRCFVFLILFFRIWSRSLSRSLSS